MLHEWGGPLSYKQVPTPSPGPGEALVKVEACAVGLTVLNYISGTLGRWPEYLPRIPGHEAVGTVVEVGPGVLAPRVGDRVMAYFYLSCGQCDFCQLAHESLCRHLRGNVGVATDGGYAEYLALPAANFLPVPEGVDPVQAAAIPDAIATPFHVCRRAAVGPGDVVVVIGAGGGVGLHMVQMARVFGARVVGIDIGDAKLGAVRDAGATAAYDFREPDLVQRIRSAAPSGPTVAVDLVGTPQTAGFGIDVLERRGRLVLLTTFPGVAFEVSPRRMVLEEISILGSRYASRWEVTQAARLVADGRVRPVVSTVLPLARVEEIHGQLRAGTLIGRGAVVM
ncbi:MAG: alcohol dehydrogenase catalytic domain-containing protein [Armatimonadota bacterium]|nr:alcohol dehydrogenase catalytic domain-containing protein [Armatimonadota bacterium]